MDGWLWSVEDLASYLKVPKNWVHQRTRFNALPGMIRLSPRHIRFDPEIIKAWIAEKFEGGQIVP